MKFELLSLNSGLNASRSTRVDPVHASVLCVIEVSLGNVYICFESGNCFLYALLKRFRDPAPHSEILQNEAA